MFGLVALYLDTLTIQARISRMAECCIKLIDRKTRSNHHITFGYHTVLPPIGGDIAYLAWSRLWSRLWRCPGIQLFDIEYDTNNPDIQRIQNRLQILLGSIVDKRSIVFRAGESGKLSLLLALLLLLVAPFALVPSVKLLVLGFGS